MTKDGKAAKLMPDALIALRRHRSDGTYCTETTLVHAPDYESSRKFYDTFHSYLHNCGADFMKVDNQSAVHLLYHDILPVDSAAENIHRAIDESAAKYFDGALINCMGCSIENLWWRPQSSISRCSNDFLPENPEWFTRHILQCSSNSLLQGVFHVCDWDMWWTDDTQAVKNSVLRAISGGPVYVSDTLGRSNKDILMPLCLEDGRILRCDAQALPIQQCIFENPLTWESRLLCAT